MAERLRSHVAAPDTPENRTLHMKRLLIGAACAASCLFSQATDFFSTEKCDELFTIGVRLGVNTTNRTMSDKAYPDCYHHESWGTGIDVGAVVGINIRDYLAIQPGFFFESRSGAYTLIGTAEGSALAADGSEIAQAGKRRSYNFTIPVLAVFGFNVTDDVRWNVEAGPYLAFVLDSKLSDKRFVVNGTAEDPLFHQKAAGFDFGFKMGTAIEILDHYYVGAHYLAGCLPAWKDRKIGNVTKDFGGVTKGWVFTIGYNF